MAQIYDLGKRAVGIVLCTGMVVLAGSVADAEYHRQRCHWKTVVVYRRAQVKYVQYVTKYDHCGRLYQARVACWKTVQIPVKKRIKVCH